MMKKKIFGFVLLGAFTMFALSTVTSCKKYDDDICALEENDAEISAALAATETALNSEISSLKSQLATAQEDTKKATDALDAAAKAAQTAADNAQAAADKAQAAADQAEKDALAAGKSAQEAKEAAEAARTECLAAAAKAQATADDALAKAVAEAQRAAGVEASLKSDIATLESALNGKITALESSLSSKISGLETSTSKNLENLQSQVAQLKEDLAAQGQSAEASAAAVKALLEKNVTEIYAKIQSVNEDLTAELKKVSDRVTTAEQDIVNLKADLAKQATTLSEYKTALDALTTRVAANETAIAALQSAIAADEAKIAALETLTATLAADKADKKDVEALAESLKEVIAALDTKADKELAANLQAELNRLAETVVNLANTVDTNKAAAEAAAKTLQDNIDALSKVVSTKADTAAVNAAINKVYQAIANLSTTLEGKITGLDTRVKSLETAVSALQSTYVTKAALTAELTTLQSKITDLYDTKADKTAVTIAINDAINNLVNSVITPLSNKVENYNTALTKALADSTKMLKDSILSKYTALDTKLIEKYNDLKDQMDANYLTLDTKVNTLNKKVDSLYNRLLAADLQIYTDFKAADLELYDKLAQQDTAFYNELMDEINTLNDEKASKTELKAEVTTINGKIDDLQGQINTVADTLSTKMIAIQKNLQDQIDEINTAIDNLDKKYEGYLKALITSINYEGQNGRIFYGQVQQTVVFPFAGAEGYQEFEAGKYLISPSAMTVYATINPNTVDFSGSTLKIINSLNEENPAFKLSACRVSDHALNWGDTYSSRAATGNGFYEMTVEPINTVSDTMPHVYNDGVLYALAADYEGVNGTQRVTSNYGLTIEASQADPVREFNWVAYKDAKCTTAWQPRPDFEEYCDYELLNDTTAYLKIFGIGNDRNFAFKFYIDYDAEAFDVAPEKKIYDGTEIDSVFEFGFKNNYINQPTPVTVYILDYFGNIIKLEKTLSYTKTMIEPFEISKTVYPGAALNDALTNSKGESVGATEAYLTEELKTALGDNYGTYTKYFDHYAVMETHSSITDSHDSVKLYKSGLFTCLYNAATCDIDKAMKVVIKVYAAQNQTVTQITANITVKTPTHLDQYVTNLPDTIPAAFNFFGNPGEELLTLCWPDLNNDSISYDLNGSFAMVKYGSVVPDATAFGADGWKLSKDSRYQFHCDAPELNVAGYPYTVTVHKSNLRTFQTGKNVIVKNASEYSTKNLDFVERVDYYNLGRFFGNPTNNKFQLGFYDYINYGIYMKAKDTLATYAYEISKDKTTYTFTTEDMKDMLKICDYRDKKKTPLDMFDLFKIRVSEITDFDVEITETGNNKYLLTAVRLVDNGGHVINSFDEAAKGKAGVYVQFDYNSLSTITSDAKIELTMTVTDKFGVKTAFKFYLVLSGTSAKAKRQ